MPKAGKMVVLSSTVTPCKVANSAMLLIKIRMLSSQEEPSGAWLGYRMSDPLFAVCKKPTTSTTNTLLAYMLQTPLNPPEARVIDACFTSWTRVGRSPPLKNWGEAYVPDFSVPCESCSRQSKVVSQ